MEQSIKNRHREKLESKEYDPIKLKIKELSKRVVDKLETNIHSNQAKIGIQESTKTLKVNSICLVYLVEYNEDLLYSNATENGEPWLIGTDNC